MPTLKRICCIVVVTMIAIFMTKAVILLILFTPDKTKSDTSRMEYHKCQNECEVEDSHLVGPFNLTQFDKIVNYCRHELKFDCFIGLHREECEYNRAAKNYTNPGYWIWDDATLYNQTYYENDQFNFWCDDTLNDVKYPKIAPHWDFDDETNWNHVTTKSYCVELLIILSLLQSPPLYS